MINELIIKSEQKITEIEAEILFYNRKTQEQKIEMNRLREICKQFNADSDIAFIELTLKAKNDLIAQLIERIFIGYGYKYRIEWKFGGCTQGEP